MVRRREAGSRRQGAGRCVAERGFTLIELLVVVTIVGILAALAAVNVRHAQIRAAENVLKGNLAMMRQALDTYYADKQKYPGSLEELVPNYLRRIPPDPITKSADTWVEVFDQPDEPEDFGAFDPSADFSTDTGGPGVVDVKSGAEGETLEGAPYGEL